MRTFLTSLAGFIGALLRRLLWLLETPLSYLFGRDIFISYARADAMNYAQQLAVGVREDVPQLSFFLDQWASVSGRTLPISLKLALRWSRMLVFIGTQHAIDSPHVRKELQAFFNRQGRFVPIDVGGALDTAMRKDEFLSAISGPGAVRETIDNVSGGTPAKEVVTRVANAVKFTRQDRRLRRAVIGTTLGVISIVATAAFVSSRIVANARQLADDATREADVATRDAKAAKDEREKALLDRDQATRDMETARDQRAVAEKLAKDANIQAGLAKKMRIEAEHLRDQARAEATRQGEIALSRQRANQSELMLRQSPARLADSVSLAIESVNRAHIAGIRDLESDRALRGSLSLLSRSVGSPQTIDGVIVETALSPDGKQVAVLTGNSDGTSVLRVVNGADSREIGSFPQNWRYLALSNDSLRISISNGRTIQTREISGNGKWELPIELDDNWVTGMALSPNGKYLALMMRNADSEEGRGFLEVREVESGKSVTALQTGIVLKSVAFSANGRLLALGGTGNGANGKPMGRALVWDLSTYAVNGTLHNNHFGRRSEMFQDEFIDAIAVGRDNRFIATASGRMATVWKKNPSGYHEIARMPIKERIDQLSFNGDGKLLHVLSGGACQTPTAECRRRSLETWESTGYWEAVIAPHSEAIEALAFQSGDQLITTVNTGFGDENARVWRASDGAEMKDLNVRADPDVRYVDARHIVGVNEGVFYVLDIPSRRKTPVTRPSVEVDTVESFSLSPDGSLLAFLGKKKGNRGTLVLLYRRDTAAYVMDRVFPLGTAATDLAISPDKKQIAVRRYNDGLTVFDIKDWRDRTPADLGTLKQIRSFQFSPDGRNLAVAFAQESHEFLGVWRLSDGHAIGKLQRTEGEVSYRFSPATDYLASTMAPDGVKLLNLRSGEVTVVPTNGAIKLVAFSPDGRLLATADRKGLVTLVQLSSLEAVSHFQHADKVSKIVFSSDGKYLATTTETDNEDQAPRDEAYLLHVWLLRPTDLVKEACERLTRLSDSRLSYCAMR
jgi:WD40 repeat protein